ncbi:MAG: hypothetical protein HFJ09_08110 [Lachnospiraceae bacterium]|nr:hypothetical protein [Lachnospiraceae bacterium]
MKRKYFLRGLGAGIILSAVVMGVSSSKADLTDAEIRKRAMELGMVEKPDALETVLKETKMPTTTGAAIEENKDNKSETEEPEITDFPTITPKVTYKPSHIQNNITLKATQTPTFTAAPKVTQTPKITSKPVSKTSTSQREIIAVTITAGMWSDQIAEKFKELGLVDSAIKFDKFLCDNDYASLIRVGSYKIPKGSSYEEIAKIITK